MKLDIELVPRSCWWSNVRSNVSKADWERCKNFVKNRSQERCELCGGRGPGHAVEAHEIWSYDEERRIQTLVGLIALCPACHEVKHIGRAFAVGTAPRAIAHFATVNNLPSLEMAEAYIQHAFDLWAWRSQFTDWTLDVSFLTSIGIALPQRIDREKAGARE